MKRCLLSMLFLICFAALGEGLEMLTKDGVPRENFQARIRGYFTDVGAISPGEDILTIVTHPAGSPDNATSDEYKFIGRTGERSFEIQHIFTSVAFRSLNSKEKLSIYVSSENPTFKLKRPLFLTNCPMDAKITVKIEEFKGNELRYKIFLPDCLK